MTFVRVNWDEGKIAYITETLPAASHIAATILAAEAAATAIRAKNGTGALEADVRTPTFVGPHEAIIGSGLPYASIQNDGGTIQAKPGGRLLIQADRGNITASATSVTIPAKRYMDAVIPAYWDEFIHHYLDGFPA